LEVYLVYLLAVPMTVIYAWGNIMIFLKIRFKRTYIPTKLVHFCMTKNNFKKSHWKLVSWELFQTSNCPFQGFWSFRVQYQITKNHMNKINCLQLLYNIKSNYSSKLILWWLYLNKSFVLTRKRPTPFFSKNTPNLPFLAQEAQVNFFYFFALSTVGSCPRLLGKHVQKALQKLTTRIVWL
jgi:hypothetical protein